MLILSDAIFILFNKIDMIDVEKKRFNNDNQFLFFSVNSRTYQYVA